MVSRAPRSVSVPLILSSDQIPAGCAQAMATTWRSSAGLRTASRARRSRPMAGSSAHL